MPTKKSEEKGKAVAKPARVKLKKETIASQKGAGGGYPEDPDIATMVGCVGLSQRPICHGPK